MRLKTWGRAAVLLLLALCLCACEIQPLLDWDMFPGVSFVGEAERPERENPLLEELSFSLLDSDIEEFYAALSRCKDIYAKGHVSYADELMDALYELDWLASWFDRQCQAAALLRMYDTSDEQARQDELYARSVCTQLNTDLWDAFNDMKHPSHPLTPTVIDYLDEVHPDRITIYFENDEYERRMDELESEFITYNYEGSASQIHGIYTEYIDVANRYAESYGYDNYYEYAAAQVYDRGYGREEREAFRALVKEHLVPLYRAFDRLWESKRDAMGFLERRQADRYSSVAYDTVSGDALFTYFDSLPEGVGDAMRAAFEEGRVLIGDRPASLYKAMVTTQDDEPVCYFHEDLLDLVTVSHEMGHFYAGTVRGGVGDISFDLSETHSQANSLLMLRYLRDEIGTDAFAAFELYEVGDMLYRAIASTVKDEFDEIVFSMSEEDDRSVEALREVMNGLIEAYGIDAREGSMTRQLRTYWHRQGIGSVGYHISYGVSAVVALEIYHLSESDYAAATSCYQRFVERSRIGACIDAVAVSVGLYSPFDERCYQQLSDIDPAN